MVEVEQELIQHHLVLMVVLVVDLEVLIQEVVVQVVQVIHLL